MSQKETQDEKERKMKAEMKNKETSNKTDNNLAKSPKPPNSNSKTKTTSKSESSKNKPSGGCDTSEEAIKYAKNKARYRSNLIDQPTYLPWVRKLEQSLQYIEEMQPVVDCKEPLVAKQNYVQLKKYNIRGEAFVNIEKRNAILVRRIGDIYAQGCRLDNRINPVFPSMNRRSYARELKTILLVHENNKINNRLKRVQPMISKQKQLDWYAEQVKYMDMKSLYPLHFKPQPCSPSYKKIVENTSQNPRQYAYLQVELEDQTVANVICELFSKLCPFTTKNFQSLCKNKKDSCACRSYRCKKVDKLVSISRPDGTYERAYWQIGSEVEAIPAFSNYLLTESTNLKHKKGGYLTKPRGVASGEFFITLEAAPYLDDLCYIFGKVIGPAMPFLNKMQEINIDTQGNPKKPMYITDCGVVANPKDVPKAMLMRDFVMRVQEDIVPLMAMDSDDDV